MKNLITMFLLLFFSFQAIASDYACKASYENRLAKLEKSKKHLDGVDLGLTAGLIISGFNPLGWIAMGTVAGLKIHKNGKNDSYLAANAMITEAQYPDRKAYIEAIRQEKINFYKERLEKKVNPKRKKKGQSQLTLNEYLAHKPLTIAKTPLDSLVEQINKRVDQEVDYATVAQMLKDRSQNESLCKNGQLTGRRKLRSLLIDDLNNEKVSVNQSERDSGKEVEEKSEPAKAATTEARKA